MRISSITIPFLKENVIPFPIKEKHSNLIKRVAHTFIATIQYMIARFKALLGIESLKDRLRLANSYLLDGRIARNRTKEDEVRKSYQRDYQRNESCKEYSPDCVPDPIQNGLFRDVNREDFVYVNDQNIAIRERDQSEENRLKGLLHQKLSTMIPKFDVLATLFCQAGWVWEMFVEPMRVFPEAHFASRDEFINDSWTDKQKFLDNYSRGFGLVVEKERYRMIFHHVYDYEIGKQRGVVGCKREYIFTKADLEQFREDMEPAQMFPNLVVMDAFSPFHFYKSEGDSEGLREKVILSLNPC